MTQELWKLAFVLALLKTRLDFFHGGTHGNGTLETQGQISTWINLATPQSTLRGSLQWFSHDPWKSRTSTINRVGAPSGHLHWIIKAPIRWHIGQLCTILIYPKPTLEESWVAEEKVRKGSVSTDHCPLPCRSGLSWRWGGSGGWWRGGWALNYMRLFESESWLPKQASLGSVKRGQEVEKGELTGQVWRQRLGVNKAVSCLNSAWFRSFNELVSFYFSFQVLFFLPFIFLFLFFIVV